MLSVNLTSYVVRHMSAVELPCLVRPARDSNKGEYATTTVPLWGETNLAGVLPTSTATRGAEDLGAYPLHFWSVGAVSGMFLD